MVKQDDVAKLAGVSSTTVSRVINNYGSLSEKTKKKVHEAMDQLNYQPNVMARSLQGKRTNMIGLIIPDVSNPFFGELVEILEEQLFKKDYRVILCDSHQDHDKESYYLKMLQANRVSGIITETHNRNLPEYEQSGLPIVSLDRYLSDNIPIVSSDNFSGGQKAAQALLHVDCQQMAVITGSNNSKSPTDDRVRGFNQALAAHNLTAKSVELGLHVSSNVKLMKIRQLLTNNEVDGIFCTDDLTALLVIQIAKKLGITIPEQLKVIGYDGTKLIRQYMPELTTIVQPIADMADLAIDLLLQRIENPEVKLEKQYVLPVDQAVGATV